MVSVAYDPGQAVESWVLKRCFQSRQLRVLRQSLLRTDSQTAGSRSGGGAVDLRGQRDNGVDDGSPHGVVRRRPIRDRFSCSDRPEAYRERRAIRGGAGGEQIKGDGTADARSRCLHVKAARRARRWRSFSESLASVGAGAGR